MAVFLFITAEIKRLGIGLWLREYELDTLGNLRHQSLHVITRNISHNNHDGIYFSNETPIDCIFE